MKSAIKRNSPRVITPPTLDALTSQVDSFIKKLFDGIPLGALGAASSGRMFSSGECIIFNLDSAGSILTWQPQSDGAVIAFHCSSNVISISHTGGTNVFASGLGEVELGYVASTGTTTPGAGSGNFASGIFCTFKAGDKFKVKANSGASNTVHLYVGYFEPAKSFPTS